jgi:hypothetical protein
MTEEIKVANTTSRDYENLSVEATIYNMDGKPVKEYCKTGNINSYSNTTTQAFVLDFERNRPIISIGKKVVASSTAQFAPEFVTDGDDNTRWAANKADNEWIYIDLDSVQTVGGVRLNWEAAYGKSYKIQVSDDAQTWREVFKTHEGCEGTLEHLFPEVQARYVRMLGIELGWWFGYSLWSMDVLGGSPATDGLSDVHFIRLKLRDSNGNIISENDYWRGNNRKDFTALNDLQPVNIKTTSRLTRNMGRATITATVSLPQSAPNVAFAIHIQALRKHDRERLLPAIMSDNYFTLMPGEKRCITIEFDESLLKNDTYELVVEPYNKPLK